MPTKIPDKSKPKNLIDVSKIDRNEPLSRGDKKKLKKFDDTCKSFKFSQCSVSCGCDLCDSRAQEVREGIQKCIAKRSPGGNPVSKQTKK